MAYASRAQELRAIDLAVRNPNLSGRALAREAGYAETYGPVLLRRLKPEIEKRRARMQRLGPALQISVGEQLRHWTEGTEPGKVETTRALKWWYQARADLRDVEIYWRDPSKLDRQKAERALVKARGDFAKLTAHTVRVHEAHGQPIPADLIAKPERSEGTLKATAADDIGHGAANVNSELTSAPSAGASAKADRCRLHPSMPARDCPLCSMAPRRCPRHGLLYEPVLIHGAQGPVGQRTGCPECEPGTVTIYATEKSRLLAWSAPERVLGQTGGGRTASPYHVPRSYDFDPFKDF